MKTVGRILLFVVGAILIVNAIPMIVNNWNLLNQSGWGDFSSYPDKMLNLSAIISQSINALFGFVAIIAAIRGKSSFWLFIFSIIMIGGVIWYFISAKNAGALGDFQNIIETVIGFALPIGYFLGSVFVRL